MGTISKLDGVAVADIAKVDGIAIADIANIGGETPPPSYANVNSFEFDDIDDEIVSDSFNAGMQLLGTDAFTVSFWFYRNTNVGHQALVGTGFYLNAWFAHIQSWAAGKYQMYFRVRGSGTWNSLEVHDNWTGTPSTWVHYLITNDGTNTGAGMIMYQDSTTTFAGAKAGTGGTTSNSDPFQISKNNYQAVGGKIDEVAIWKGNALTPTQVAEVYNSGTPVNLNALPTGPAPTTWYRMGEKATFSNPGGVGDWSLVDQGSLGVNATSGNMAEAARTTDVP